MLLAIILYSLYHLLDRFEVEQCTKLNSFKPSNVVWKFYSNFVTLAFKKYMA